MPEKQGRLKITAERGGTIQEFTSFLTDLDRAYIALYQMDGLSFDLRRGRKRIPLDILVDVVYPLTTFGLQTARLNPQEVPPRDRLVVSPVRISHPASGKYLALSIRCNRFANISMIATSEGRDGEFREAAEKEKLALENELIKRQIYEKENSVLRERMAILETSATAMRISSGSFGAVSVFL